MAYSPSAILAGGDSTVFGESSTLTITIFNESGSSAKSGLGFTNTLPIGLTIGSAPVSQCGGTVTVSGQDLIFSGGSLAAGPSSCLITATVTAPAGGTFTNKGTDITGLAGGLTNGATDQTLHVYAYPTSVSDTTGDVTASNLGLAGSNLNSPNVDFTLQVDATNNNAFFDATVTVNVTAVDVNGAAIPSTATAITGSVPAGTTAATFFNFGSVSVPITDVAKIQFWRILSVTATFP